MNDFYGELDKLYSAGDTASVEAFILSAISAAPDGSPERAGLLNEIAGFYRGISRYPESEASFEQALGIFEAAGMGASPEYATVLLNFAGLYRIIGQSDKAIGLFKDAGRKLEDAGARESYAYVSIINNLALAYLDKGEHEAALEHACSALELMRGGLGQAHEIATSLNNIAAIRMRMNNLEAAEKLISESLAIYEAMPEPDVHHAAAIATKAAIKCRTGDYFGALEGFKQALELTGRSFGENIEFAACRRNIADVYELLDDIPSAIAELSSAAEIMERILGASHPTAMDARKRLESLKNRS
jgi:tetratricopeptide (TPR) repeat protein